MDSTEVEELGTIDLDNPNRQKAIDFALINIKQMRAKFDQAFTAKRKTELNHSIELQQEVIRRLRSGRGLQGDQ